MKKFNSTLSRTMAMMISSTDRIAKRDGDGAGDYENDDEGIGKQAEKTDQSGKPRLPHQRVWAVEMQSLFRLC
jgi:hypothetical protein